MSLSVYDCEGFVADVASNAGWSKYAAWARGQGGALADLAKDGWSEEVEPLQKQMGATTPTEPDLASVHAALLAAARKADGVVVVTDGVGLEGKGAPPSMVGKMEVDAAVLTALACLKAELPVLLTALQKRGEDAAAQASVINDIGGPLTALLSELDAVDLDTAAPARLPTADEVYKRMAALDDVPLPSGITHALADAVQAATTLVEQPSLMGDVSKSETALSDLPTEIVAEVNGESCRVAVKYYLVEKGVSVPVQKPYPNEHAARMADPGDFVPSTFRSKTVAPGLRLILGRKTKNGPMEVQAYRFDREKFTAAEARKWLADHNLKPVEFAEATEKTLWTGKYINDLPDSAFLYIESGGEKDDQGKTTPRGLRHFPVMNHTGAVDLPHLRNALARIPQSNLPQKVRDAATARAQRMLEEEKDDAEKAERIGTMEIGKVCVAKADERFVLGIVLEPETVDSQKDIYSAEEIRQAAHRFMEEFQNTGYMHRKNVNDKVKVLESYVAPCDFSVNGQSVKKGSWVLAARVNDDEMWRQIKEGEITGWSIGGSAIRRREGTDA